MSLKPGSRRKASTQGANQHRSRVSQPISHCERVEYCKASGRRGLWRRGAPVRVYSLGVEAWCPGEISSITEDEEGHCLDVRYWANNNSKAKYLSPNSDHIREIRDAPTRNEWKKGDKLQCWSNSDKCWYTCLLVEIVYYNEDSAREEWLRLQWTKEVHGVAQSMSKEVSKSSYWVRGYYPDMSQDLPPGESDSDDSDVETSSKERGEEEEEEGEKALSLVPSQPQEEGKGEEKSDEAPHNGELREEPGARSPSRGSNGVHSPRDGGFSPPKPSIAPMESVTSQADEQKWPEERAELLARIDDLEMQLEMMEDDLQNERETSGPLLQEIEKLKIQVSKLRKDKEKLEQKLKRAKSRGSSGSSLDDVMSAASSVHDTGSVEENDVAAITQMKLEGLNQANSKLCVEKKVLQEEIKELRGGLSDAHDTIRRMESDMRSTNAKERQSKNETERLKKELEALKAQSQGGMQRSSQEILDSIKGHDMKSLWETKRRDLQQRADSARRDAEHERNMRLSVQLKHDAARTELLKYKAQASGNNEKLVSYKARLRTLQAEATKERQLTQQRIESGQRALADVRNLRTTLHRLEGHAPSKAQKDIENVKHVLDHIENNLADIVEPPMRRRFSGQFPMRQRGMLRETREHSYSQSQSQSMDSDEELRNLRIGRRPSERLVAERGRGGSPELHDDPRYPRLSPRNPAERDAVQMTPSTGEQYVLARSGRSQRLEDSQRGRERRSHRVTNNHAREERVVHGAMDDYHREHMGLPQAQTSLQRNVSRKYNPEDEERSRRRGHRDTQHERAAQAQTPPAQQHYSARRGRRWQESFDVVDDHVPAPGGEDETGARRPTHAQHGSTQVMAAVPEDHKFDDVMRQDRETIYSVRWPTSGKRSGMFARDDFKESYLFIDKKGIVLRNVSRPSDQVVLPWHLVVKTDVEKRLVLVWINKMRKMKIRTKDTRQAEKMLQYLTRQWNKHATNNVYRA